MSDLAFDLEWVDPEGARGPELRATWARLTLRVGKSAVTRVFDERTRSVRESIYLPVYPLAEWVAANWWRLLFEVPSPRAEIQNGYRSRHCLSTVSEGFALPDLLFEPLGQTVRLSWASKRLTRAPVEFLGGDSVLVCRERVVAGLEAFVEAVLGRLEDEGVVDSPLGQEWDAIRRLTSAEEEFCRFAGTLGLDPFRIREEEARELIEAAAELPEAAREEFFSSADPSSFREEARAVHKALSEAATKSNRHLEPLRDLYGRFRIPDLLGEPPWTQGYAAAQALRADLGLDGAPLASFETLGQSLGLQGLALEREIGRAEGLETVDGVVAFDTEARPGFALRATAEAARRFGFCRELFEYLAAREPRPLLVTRSGTHQQQRNRAFAAEFLLPSESLRSQIPRSTARYEEVNEIADEFGVSWAVVKYQLENHGIARITAD